MGLSQIKQYAKQALTFIAPKAASAWQSERQRRHARNFEQRLGLSELTRSFIAEHGIRVLDGPFAGMVYISLRHQEVH